ncbi:unnamed protein product [Peniophora sp. CBMAI 1063]|nr:unnamed protein product [Peniophora sp. CBMAI 1063]
MPSLPIFGYTAGSFEDSTSRRIFVELASFLLVLYCILGFAYYKAVISLRKDGLHSTLNRVYLCTISTIFSRFSRVAYTSLSWRPRIYTSSQSISRVACFAVNVILGDAIILWRALIIWAWRKTLVYISAFLLLVTTALWIYTVIELNNDDTSSFVSIPASLATSLFATGAISLKAWQHHSLLREKVVIMSRRSTLENILALLTESGIVFTLLWVIYFVSYFVTRLPVFYAVMTVLMTIAAPLYPFIIIILVAKHKTPLSDKLTSIEPETQVVEVENHELLSRSSSDMTWKDDVLLREV